VEFDRQAWVMRPFVRPSSGHIRYHPALPADSMARTLAIRPLRVLLRPWILPDSHEKASGLWSPTRHARHPRVWGFLLAAIDEDIERYQLDFNAIYHYKRYADEFVADDDPEATSPAHILYDSLPICLMRVEMLGCGVGPIDELPVAPATLQVLRSS
jgi:hypothetical protein